VYNLKPPADVVIVIYTNEPAMFEAFTPYFENFEIIDTGFVNRFELLAQYGQTNNVIYCNTDCYLDAPFKNVFDNIESGFVFVYQPGELSAEETSQLQAVKTYLTATTVMINDETISYPPNIKYYDIQSLGLNHQSVHLINNITALTKKLLIKFTFDIAEKFAFAYYLYNKQVQFLKGRFKDFKDLPEFKELLQLFFSKNEEESIPNLVKLIHHLDVETIQKDKVRYARLPFYKKWMNQLLGKEWSIKKYGNKI
jgi:hypothetical protein